MIEIPGSDFYLENRQLKLLLKRAGRPTENGKTNQIIVIPLYFTRAVLFSFSPASVFLTICLPVRSC